MVKVGGLPAGTFSGERRMPGSLETSWATAGDARASNSKASERSVAPAPPGFTE